MVARMGTSDRRRAEYGVVFCEVPPGGPWSPAGAPTPRPRGSRARLRSDAQLQAGAGGSSDQRPGQAVSSTEGVSLPYVDAEPARAHLARLSQAGVGLKRVAWLSGVSNGSLTKIVYGQPSRGRPPSRRVRPDTLARILAVTVPEPRGGQRVAAGPTWRLVDELMAAGYSRSWLARALGSEAALPRLQLGRDTVRASTARAVEDLHRRLLGGRP